jgi:hypothetical protein
MFGAGGSTGVVVPGSGGTSGPMGSGGDPAGPGAGGLTQPPSGGSPGGATPSGGSGGATPSSGTTCVSGPEGAPTCDALSKMCNGCTLLGIYQSDRLAPCNLAVSQNDENACVILLKELHNVGLCGTTCPAGSCGNATSGGGSPGGATSNGGSSGGAIPSGGSSSGGTPSGGSSSGVTSSGVSSCVGTAAGAPTCATVTNCNGCTLLGIYESDRLVPCNLALSQYDENGCVIILEELHNVGLCK